MAKEKLISTNTLLYYHTAIKNLLAEKVDKITGYSLMSDAEITRLSSVVNYNDTDIQSAITTMQGQIGALQSGTYDDTSLKLEISSTYATIASLIALETTVSGKADATALQSHADDAEIHVTQANKTAWDAKADQADLDALTTTVGTKVSTTDMNTALTNLENTINGKLTAAMHYKGTVNTFANLPTDPEVGDVYNVETAGTDSDSNPFSAGANAAWNGTKWDILPGTVDLTNYYNAGDMAQNSDIDTILNS